MSGSLLLPALERVGRMATDRDGVYWSLSEYDRAALQDVLEERAALVKAVEQLMDGQWQWTPPVRQE